MSDNQELADLENQVITHAPQTPPSTSIKTHFFPRCCKCCGFDEPHFNEDDSPNGTRNAFFEELAPRQKILVLDLDETLVHCSFRQPDHYDDTIQIAIEGIEYQVFIQKRPNLQKFLNRVMTDFYVIIFTASLSEYANPIIDIICPSLPHGQRLFRESCLFVDGIYIKDLSIFHTPLDNIIIVDNNPCSFLFHSSNAILSDTWEGDLRDTQLIDEILPILNECKNAKNVQIVLSKFHK